MNTNASVRSPNQQTTYVDAFRMSNGTWFTCFVRNLRSFSVLMTKLWGVPIALQVAWFMHINTFM